MQSGLQSEAQIKRYPYSMKCLTLAIVALLLTSCVPSVYDPYPVEAVVLPEDDGAHTAPIEWWYYTGHFEDEAGTEYGFELTFFKAYAPQNLKLFGFLPAYAIAEKGHVAHFAITDVTNQNFEKAQKADFWGYEGEAARGRLDVSLSNWSAKRAPDGVSHDIVASVGDRTLSLRLTPEKDAALHGDPPGIQSMGEGGTSYYVSYTRMSAEGELRSGCGFFGCAETQAVTGQGWHDHQWGDFDVTSYAGWDWFSLQFEDNTELMLYLIRQPNGTYSAQAGSFVRADGRVVELESNDFTLSETGATWTSEDTGAIYPMSWQIEVPNFDIDIEVEPVMLEQEMNTRASTGIVYWEGAVGIEGNRDGKGYVELTNYDLYPYGQTDDSTPLKPLRGPFGG